MLSLHEKLPRQDTISLRHKYVGASCKLFFKTDPLKMVRAHGQYMYTEKNVEYLDCINNVCHVGHCHPHVVAAGCEQMALLNTNSRFLHDNMVLLAERLTKTLPSKLNVVFFVNSGSEANDLALRMARNHTGSREVITLEHAYHGHVGSLMDISPYKFKDTTEIPDTTHVASVPDVYRGKYRNDVYSMEELRDLYGQDVKDIVEQLNSAGKKPGVFISESLQSCGGQIIYPPGYLDLVYKIVRKAGGVVIADEVQVGFGRVGSHMWGFQTQGPSIVPDIVTLGKPMGNGHPIAAVVTTEEIANSFTLSGIEYFNTYGGNPVSCAIALAVMDVIENENLLENATEVGNYLQNGIRKLKEEKNYKMIGDVRGMGLFIGVDIVKDHIRREPFGKAASHILNRFKEERILIQTDGPHNNVLKFKPPMVFNKENAERVIRTLDMILSEMEAMSME